jgi:hypothetical protein
MIGGTLLLAAGFIGAQIYLLKTMSKTHDADIGDKPPAAPAWLTTTLPTETKTDVKHELLEARLAEVARLASLHQQWVAETVPEQGLRLNAIGSMTGMHLYQTFLNIGLTADLFEKKVYTIDVAKGLLEQIGNFNDAAERQLIQIPPSSFKTEEDRQGMELARTVTTLLRTEMKELKAFWETGDADHLARYHKAREETWLNIKKLARIKE